MKYNIAIIDDHKLFRAGLKTLLEGLETCGSIVEASGGEEFIKLLSTEDINIALMDIDMPGMNGMETTRRALEIDPDLKVICLSMYDDDEYYSSMIDAGVKGFVIKNAEIDELNNAIIKVGAGEKYFSPEKLYNIVLRKKNAEPVPDALTIREKDVLKLVCEGLSNREIAKKLQISKRTVDKHRENILSKTGCHNTAMLIMYANKNKLI